MPFKNEAQRRALWAKHPDIARRWTAEFGSRPQPSTGANRIPKRDDFAGLTPSAKARHTYKKPAREQESMKEGPVRAAAAARAGKMNLMKG